MHLGKEKPLEDSASNDYFGEDLKKSTIDQGIQRIHEQYSDKVQNMNSSNQQQQIQQKQDSRRVIDKTQKSSLGELTHIDTHTIKMLQDTQAQKTSAMNPADEALLSQPLLQDYQQDDALVRQQMMNESCKPSQTQQLERQNKQNDAVQDSDQKSINVHDSKLTINENEMKQKASQSYTQSTKASQSQFASEEFKGSSSKQTMESNIAQERGKGIPIREINLSNYLNDKGKIRRDMNEQLGHDRQLNLNPEEVHEQYVKDSSFETGLRRDVTNASTLTDLETLAKQGIKQQSSGTQNLDLNKVNAQQQQKLQVQITTTTQIQQVTTINSSLTKGVSESEPPRGTFGDSVDWKDLKFNDKENLFIPPKTSQVGANLQQQQEIKQKQVNQDYYSQGAELGELDIANKEPILDQAQPDFAKKSQDTQWTLIDKIKFAMYNKIYKMFAEEQKDLKDDEFDDEVDLEDKNLVQEARNIEQVSSFDEYTQAPTLLRRRSSQKGQELMRRFQCAIKKKLGEMQKDFEEDQGIIFRDENKEATGGIKGTFQKQQRQQRQLPRRKLSKEEETHERSQSPERTHEQATGLIKNKIIESKPKQQKPRIFEIRKKRPLKEDIGKPLTSKIQPQLNPELLVQTKKRSRAEFEKGISTQEQPRKGQVKFYTKDEVKEEGYDVINGWKFQKDRSNIFDGFEEGDLANLFNETKFWKSCGKLRKQAELRKTQKIIEKKQKQQKNLLELSPKKGEVKFYTKDDIEEGYDVINGWKFQKDRSNIFDGFEEGDLKCLFDESEFWDSIAKDQALKQQQIKQKAQPRQIRQKKEKEIHPHKGIIKRYTKADIPNKNYDVINGWMFQKDRSKINDGFRAGDLTRLFDDSQFWKSIEKAQLKKSPRIQVKATPIQIRAKKEKEIHPHKGIIKRYKKSDITDKNYGVRNGWMFQKDRSHIDDGFQEGDLACLFDETPFWQSIRQERIKREKLQQLKAKPKHKQIRKKKEKAIHPHRGLKKHYNKSDIKDENYDVINGWMFLKDRTNINDGFEEGDLVRLFDERKFWRSCGKLRKQAQLKKAQQQKIDEENIWLKKDLEEVMYKSPKRGHVEFYDEKDVEEGYSVKNGWKYQIDRSEIFDGFEEGDLQCLFDESEFWDSVGQLQIQQQKLDEQRRKPCQLYYKKDRPILSSQGLIRRYKKSDIKKQGYDVINGWMFQKDRSQINDGFEQGDLLCLFNEYKVVQRIRGSIAFMNQNTMLDTCLPKRGRIPYYYKSQVTEAGYDVKNGWKFQYDRSNINDGFEEGDLQCLFDDTAFWDAIELRKTKMRGYIKRYTEADSNNEYGVINGWRFQKDRSNINDGFEQGDLECLFDESQVLDKWETSLQKRFREREERYNTISGWRYQIDRSQIFDGFEEGDLDRLFDESQVLEKFDTYAEAKRKRKEAEYDTINGWRFQKDRTHIFDGFVRGDLARLFDERPKRIKRPKPSKDEYRKLHGWRFQRDRTNIDDGFQAEDLPILFDECSFWSESTTESLKDLGTQQKEFKFTKKPNVIVPVPNELDYQEQLRALQLKRKIKKRKPQDKLKMQQEEQQDFLRSSISGFDLFGDPNNLSRKTMCTSEDHLIITPQVKLGKVFQRESDKIQEKPSLHERRMQSLRDKEQARLKKEEQERQQRLELEEKRNKSMKNLQLKLKQGLSTQLTKEQSKLEETPKLTLNQKKKLKRKERKQRQLREQQHQELWESLENAQISSPYDDTSFNEMHLIQEERQKHGAQFEQQKYVQVFQ